MLKLGFQSILVFSGILSLLCASVKADNESIRWFQDFQAGVQYATAQQLPIMLHFYGESCPPCKMLEKRAYKNAELVSKINNQMVAIKINGDQQRELRERYRITSWPTDVYLTPTGKELYRTTSPQDAAVYAQLVDRVALQCADWNVERMAARKSEERRLANRTSTQIMQSGQSPIDPSMTGPVAHPIMTQSRVAGPSPAMANGAVNPKQRRIDNPHIADRPIVVPPAQNNPSPDANSVPLYPVNPQYASFADQHARQATTNATSVPHARPSEQMAAPAQPPVNPGLPVANRPVVVQQIASNTNLLPANTTNNGLDGFCPVTLVMKVRSKSSDCWVEGKPEFAVRHRGRIYLCASEEARRIFLAAPDEFAPALSNYDLIHFVKTGELIDGQCEFGSFQPTTGKVFLFANQQNCLEFQQMESHYSELLQRGLSPERIAEQPHSSNVR